MKRHAIRASALALCFLLAQACALMPSPKSFNERLAAGYVAVTAARESALTLLEQGAISAPDARNVQGIANEVRTGLDLAREFGATEVGEDKLAATLVILTQLQRYLHERGKP